MAANLAGRTLNVSFRIPPDERLSSSSRAAHSATATTTATAMQHAACSYQSESHCDPLLPVSLVRFRWDGKRTGIPRIAGHSGSSRCTRDCCSPEQHDPDPPTQRSHSANHQQILCCEPSTMLHWCGCCASIVRMQKTATQAPQATLSGQEAVQHLHGMGSPPGWLRPSGPAPPRQHSAHLIAPFLISP